HRADQQVEIVPAFQQRSPLPPVPFMREAAPPSRDRPKIGDIPTSVDFSRSRGFMGSRQAEGYIVVGAGAAGLMAARELLRAGRAVTVLEARDRLGGRIFPLVDQGFGYPAEGGAEFVHGAAPITRSIASEAGLHLNPRAGERRGLRGG